MATYRIKRFSLPSDWDEDDDKYVRMVEKAKERNKKIARIGPYIAPVGYGLSGALIGGIAGSSHSTKGAIVGSLAGAASGVAGSYTGKKLADSFLKSKGIKPRSYKELSERDQKQANRALSKYRKMKTKEERSAYRKKIGSKI